MNIEYCWGDDGEAFFAKGHIPIDEFTAALAAEPKLKGEPKHCWMRVCRDFQAGSMVYAEAKPASKGAFKCTWLDQWRDSQ